MPTADRATSRQTSEKRSEETRPPRAWNVVLLDDQDHTYEYVIRMVRELFAMDAARAFRVASAVDGEGRAVCLTTHKEHAELKRDQILAYGKDPLIACCAGSMSAVIEPAECDDADEAP
ncbi:MAG: ATP-dependent Clp protease adaptor ClpS [Phycisphaerae bacterium]|nr:ATP-dependent Clp protease adaptor ClpS [Phycisphaerae bacterium]